MNPRILEALAVTCAATNTEMPEAAVRVIASDLDDYPEDSVLAALKRCRREVTGKLSLAAILERLDDGRPGAEEAWAATPRSERESVVWTDEWARAWDAASPHVEAGDLVAGRMAFLEVYRRTVAEARASCAEPTWSFSRGFDLAGRENAVVDAVRLKRLTVERALRWLPTIDENRLLSVAPEAVALLEARRQLPPPNEPGAAG